MSSALGLGRYVFAMAIAGCGLQHLIVLTAKQDLAPGPPWFVAGAFWACIIGATFLLTGVGMAVARRSFLPAAALGTLLVIYGAVVYLPGIVTEIRTPDNWTRCSKIVAIGAAALVIAGSTDEYDFRWPRLKDQLVHAGLLLFGVSVLVWAAQHFIYARFSATIVPAWMPWRLFWALFVGAIFLSTSVAFAFRVRTDVAGVVLGVTFFFIVVLVHVPRVVAAPLNGREWTSVLVAIVMCGASFAVADARLCERHTRPLSYRKVFQGMPRRRDDD